MNSNTMPTSPRYDSSAPRSVCSDRWSEGVNGRGWHCRAAMRSARGRGNIEHGCAVGQADHLRGAEIQLEFPSVGATENILMAAVLAEGTTTIHNAAREPDVVDLCTMLNEMGAQISGAGTPTMTI